jgi:regulatory helix-turn-helix LysR family protein
MAVELAQIEAFLAVAEELHFGRAAALLGIDAAQVTRRVQSLERLLCDVPGALGRIMTRLADAGVPLAAQYSDHDNRKVLIVDDPAAARAALA